MKFLSNSKKFNAILVGLFVLALLGSFDGNQSFVAKDLFSIKDAQATCNIENPFPPHITAIDPPSGTYDNPGIIPVSITGTRGGMCVEGSYPVWFETEFYYIFTAPSGNVVAEGTWDEGPCNISCSPDLYYEQTVSADTWAEAGQYSLYVEAIEVGNQTVHSMTVQFNITREGFSCNVVPLTHTMDPGSSFAYEIRTSPVGNFNSPVSFTSSISPSSGNVPSVSLPNNGQVPPATVVVNVSTQASTDANTYTITFIGNGGGKTASCNTQLRINPPTPDFQLTLSPSTGIVPNPNRANIGSEPVFRVMATCTGGFAGPITNLEATTTFTNAFLTLGATQIDCGGSTTLTVGNTSAVPLNQQSSMINTILESIQVTGRGQIN